MVSSEKKKKKRGIKEKKEKIQLLLQSWPLPGTPEKESYGEKNQSQKKAMLQKKATTCEKEKKSKRHDEV